MTRSTEELESLSLEAPIWDRFFTVAPLVVIGTKEADGSYDLAPKHMATPLGWNNYFGFVCSRDHSTLTNAEREGGFTVSFPRPDEVLVASLAAGARRDGKKSQLDVVPKLQAEVIDAPLLAESYLFLECELVQIVEGFGGNALVAGRIVAARARRSALRTSERDDAEVLAESPLIAYLDPGRWTAIGASVAFPFPADFKR